MFIYFADYSGVHKTDRIFEITQTLVNGEKDSDSQVLDSLRFTYLQYYNGKIYFLNKGVSSIYFMEFDGSEETRVLDFSEETDTEITEFVVSNGAICFNYWSKDTTLKSL